MYHKYSEKDVDSIMRGPGIRFRAEGDTATVIPYYDEDDELEAFRWPRHWNGPGAKPPYSTCEKIHGPDTPCPLCEAGQEQDWRASITVWDVQAGKRRFLDGIPAGAFREMCKMVRLYRAQKQDPHAYMFVLTRMGKKDKNKIDVQGLMAPAEARAKALHMLTHSPEEMVPDAAADDAPPVSDAPPPDDEPPF